jgi:hypothetical protein
MASLFKERERVIIVQALNFILWKKANYGFIIISGKAYGLVVMDLPLVISSVILDSDKLCVKLITWVPNFSS